MKHKILQLFVCCLFVSLFLPKQGFAQQVLDKKITISVNDIELRKVLEQVQKQAGVHFLYSPNTIDDSKKVSFHIKDKSLKDFFTEMLASYGISFKFISDKKFLLFIDRPQKGSVSDLAPPVVEKKETPSIVVKGIVKDSSGNPLSGVTITDKSTGLTAVTDSKGSFSIKVSDNFPVLRFRHIGFATLEKSVNATGFLSVSLFEVANSLNEVVVIGYGSVKKKDLTGSVSKVNIADLNKAPVRSFDEALAGRIAGVQVSSADGQPGASVTISIRGNNSLTQDNSPLYVIDGFPIENPNNNIINPAEIETMEVLKDASATAIYGARGASGVIIITTKKGKVGAPVISFDAYYGSQTSLKRMAVMDPYNFIKYQYDLDSNKTKNTFFINGKTLDSYKNVKGIDWQGLLFRTAPMENLNLSLTGGTATTKYSISGSALSQQGTVINSDYTRYQARFVLDQSVGSKAKVGINVNYSNLIANGASTTITTAFNGNSRGLMYSVWGFRPVSGDSTNYNLLHNLFDTSIVLTNDYRGNPIINTSNILNRKATNALIANIYFDYTLSSKLRLRMTGGMSKTQLRSDVFYGLNTVQGNPASPVGANGPNGSVNYANTNTWVNENTLTYNNQINRYNLINILGGATFQGTTSDSYGYSAIQVPNDQLGICDLGEGIPLAVSAGNSSNKLASFLSRVNYTYLTKYLFTVSFRADGSSKFSPENRWSYFPSAAFAWKLGDESFMKKLSWVSDAKIRTSWGVTGNNRVGDFSYQYSIYSPISATYMFNNSPSRSAIPYSLGNPNLKWETTVQSDLGLDVSFLNQRIDITTDYYNKDTKNLLLFASLPTSMGYSNAYKNIGQVRNSGLELSINTINIKSKNFSWSTSFNITFNKSKVIALTQNQETLLSSINFDQNYATPLYMAKINQPISQIIGYKWDGVYQYADFNQVGNKYLLKDNVPNNGNARNVIQPGDIKYRDINGDGVVDNNDITVIGNPYPKHIGGLSNTFKYKSFDLGIFFQWSYGNDIVNLNKLIFDGNQLGVVNLNQYASYENRWTPTNTNTNIYRSKGGGPKGIFSTRIIEDGSYLRLKTIQVGYNLPAAKLKRVGIKSMRVYASGQNLFTWTKYSGMDPEVSSYQTTLTPGADYSSYPRARTTTIGVNINF